MHAHISGVG